MPDTPIARRALAADAVLTSTSGLVLGLGGAALAEPLDVPAALLIAIGVALLAWTALVVVFARRRPTRRRELELVIAGNLGWVVGAIVVLAIPATLSSGGKWALAAVSLVVAAFGAVQLSARQREFSA